MSVLKSMLEETLHKVSSLLPSISPQPKLKTLTVTVSAVEAQKNKKTNSCHHALGHVCVCVCVRAHVCGQHVAPVTELTKTILCITALLWQLLTYKSKRQCEGLA